MALSMLAGCSGKNNDGPGADESISLNVIGSDNADLPELGEGEAYITDANGGYVTGVDGNVLVEPSAPDNADPVGTLSPDDVVNAFTETTTAANLELTAIAAGERYAYTTLTADEKKLYDEIVSGVEGLRYKICDEDAYTIE